MKIARNANGLVDFWIGQMESIDGRDDMELSDRIKLMGQCGKEIRGVMALNLQYKKLVAATPDIAKSVEIVLPVGSETKKVKTAPAAE